MDMMSSIVKGEVFSSALGRPVQLTALLPMELSRGGYTKGKKFKTVYMLPGALAGSDEILKGMDLAKQLSSRYPELVVIMPMIDFSYCVDYQLEYRFGHQYYTFITKELIDITRALFPLSERREDTAIYGHSMGAYGAYYCGLNNPDVYSCVGSQSGMLDVQWAVDNRPFMDVKHQRQFGNPIVIKDTNFDLYHVLDVLDQKAEVGDPNVPRIYQSWGEEDYLKVPNERIHNFLVTKKHLDYVFHVIPGPHSWGINNQGVWLFLDFILGDKEVA